MSVTRVFGRIQALLLPRLPEDCVAYGPTTYYLSDDLAVGARLVVMGPGRGKLAMIEPAPDSMQVALLLAVVPEVWSVDEAQRQVVQLDTSGGAPNVFTSGMRIEARAFAGASLGIDEIFSPLPDERAEHWLQQFEELVRLVRRARHVLVVSGRRFAPVLSSGSTPHSALLVSDQARLSYWIEKSEDLRALASWRRDRPAAPAPDPYRALLEFVRRGMLDGVIVETPFGHLHESGLKPEQVVGIYGSLAKVECLKCGTRTPAAPALQAFRATTQVPRCKCGGFLKFAVTAVGQSPRPGLAEQARQLAARADLVLVLGSRLALEPSKSIALERVYDGKASLVMIDSEAPSEDVAPHLYVEADPARTMQLLARAL